MVIRKYGVLVMLALVCVLAQPVGAAAIPFAPIVEARVGYLLGGTVNGTWLNATAAAARMRGGEGYRLYGVAGLVGRATGTKPASEGPPCESTLFVKLGMPPAAARIAVGGTWSAAPRVPISLSTSSAVYRQAVADVLKQRGIRNPDVRLTKVLRIDLEGDGVDEVLLSATKFKGMEANGGPTSSANAGDYSIALLRRVVQGKVVTTVIDADIILKAVTFGAPTMLTIGAVVDLNGDGRLEMVINDQYYEGDGVTVYRIEGARVIKTLDTGCGA